MNLSLGNMLGKRMAINPDGLSLDLAFAADKTLTARKGPTPTFTRASTATFVGSNGLIQSAAINEARFDHDPVTLDCKGLLIEEARTNALLNSNALATQNVTVTAAARTLSFYGTGTVVLSNTHVATVVGTGAFPARTTLTFTPTAGTLTLTVTGTVEFAQLEIGAFPTSYIPTTTAALTRSVDVCSVTTAGWSNAGNDTMLASYFVNHFISGAIVVEGGPLLSWMSISFTGNRRQRNLYRHGGISTRLDAQTNDNTVSLVSNNKVILTSGEQLALNGSLTQNVASDPSQADISTSLNIGRRSDFGGAASLNGHIARIQYFRKRLPNAKLITLTT